MNTDSMKHSLLILSTAALLASCGGKKEDDKKNQPPPPVQVTIQNVKDTIAVYYDEFPATVAALNQIDLRSQVSGNITGIFFKDGDQVRKGQLLYTIDQQLYQANLQQAVANLRVQEANVVKAQKDADRYHTLDAQDAVAKQLVDNADAALAVSQRQADAARANITALQTNVKYTRVYAPFNGTIGISQVKVGSPVSAGTTVLNTISTDNPIAVDVNIDQQQIFRFGNMQLQQDTMRQKNDSTFRLAFQGEEYPQPGSISLIDRAVDPQTGTIRMRLVFPNNKGVLRAGMSGNLRVKSNTNTTSVVIPYKAVTEQLGEFFVYVVGDSNKVSQRKIVLGPQVDSNVIIHSGLKPGEPIVVQGMQNLKEGAVVTTQAPKPQQAADPAKKP
jgi:membrane fusion protein, multidrug efflux system